MKPVLGEIRRGREIEHWNNGGSSNYIWHACIDCGKERWVTLHKGLPENPRCRSCASKKRNKLGSNHWNWKGGRTKTTQGYVMVQYPSHPKANPGGYVREHLLIWERTHNKPLPEGWIIHHLNGIKNDNRPRNLLGMPRKEHNSALVLKEVQKALRELEIENSQLKQVLEANKLVEGK